MGAGGRSGDIVTGGEETGEESGQAQGGYFE